MPAELTEEERQVVALIDKMIASYEADQARFCATFPSLRAEQAVTTLGLLKQRIERLEHRGKRDG